MGSNGIGTGRGRGPDAFGSRSQALRGPPWPWRPPVGPAAARRGLAGGGAEPGLTAPIAPMGPSPPLMGQTPPAPPPSPPLVGQDPSLIAPSPSLLPPSPPAAMGQDPLSMGQSMGLAPHAMGPGAPEVRLEELGLGACTPVGLVQNFLQFLHLDVGLPWWGAIAAGTLCVRVALLPLLLRAQREAAVLALHTPRLQQLSKGLAQARRGSDQREVARAYTELVGYQQRHNLNPLRGFLVPLVQTPVFVSFFLALQGMAAAPVPGLQWGGLGWFQDLSAPDPYYLLPVLVTASMGLVLELGAETGVSSPGGGAMRQLLRLLPLICLPFILHFPTAIFTYWLTSNSFSLLHVALLRVPALRARLGLPPPVKGGGVTPGGGGEKKGLIARMKQGKGIYGALWGSMGCLWGSMGVYGVSMGCLWGVYGVSMGVYGVSMGVYGGLWGSMGCLWVSMGVYGGLWGVYGVSMGCLWGVYGGLWGSMGVYGCLWGLWGLYVSLWVSPHCRVARGSGSPAGGAATMAPTAPPGHGRQGSPPPDLRQQPLGPPHPSPAPPPRLPSSHGRRHWGDLMGGPPLINQTPFYPIHCVYGALWVSMGSLWVSMGSLWVSVGLYGSLWGSMGLYVSL
uniref:Membrane insertase YidC/Oxa/ALB C-terminal domain-containing protein n=1 Tax=Melopsittacus undulatus TaxID=13146 RepID=A0A8V5GJQ2_MELUD